MLNLLSVLQWKCSQVFDIKKLILLCVILAGCGIMEARHDLPGNLDPGRQIFYVRDPVLHEEAMNLLMAKAGTCYKCHKPGGRRPFKVTGALEDWIQQGWLVVGDSQASELYKEIENDEMPKRNPFNQEQKEIVQDWIDNGLTTEDPDE